MNIFSVTVLKRAVQISSPLSASQVDLIVIVVPLQTFVLNVGEAFEISEKKQVILHGYILVCSVFHLCPFWDSIPAHRRQRSP